MTEDSGKLLTALKHITMPLILLIASTMCIQLHAYKYWEETMGHGLLYSLTIEGVAIAFWIYTRLTDEKAVLAIAVFATVLSFTAPAMKNLIPIVNEFKVTIQKIDVWDLQKERLENDAELLMATWNTNRENSESRGGWLEATRDAQIAYQLKADELNSHLLSKPSILDIVMNNIQMMTILISIAVLQFASVFFSRFIGDGVRKAFEVRISEDEDTNDLGETLDVESQKPVERMGLHLAYSNQEEEIDVVTYVSRAIRDLQEKDKSLTNQKLAEPVPNCHPRDISLLINHEDKIKQRATNPKVRIVSENKARDIASIWGVDLRYLQAV